MFKLKSHTLNAQAQAQVPDSSNLLNQEVLDSVREGVDSLGINWKKRAEMHEAQVQNLRTQMKEQELRLLRGFFSILQKVSPF